MIALDPLHRSRRSTSNVSRPSLLAPRLEEARRALGDGASVWSEVPAQRAAVEVREVLDVVQEQAVPADQGVDRGAGEVAEVLVVDRVELAVLDQVAHVGVLDRDDAVVGQQDRACRRRSR